MNDSSVARVFVVDDDECIRVAVCAILKRANYDCTCFSDVAGCLEELRRQNRDLADGCDLLLTDVKMPGRGGLELLQEVRKTFPWIPVIMMTAYGSIPMSVQAVRTGAFDFIEKPVEEAKLLSVVESALLKEAELHDPLVGKPLTRTEHQQQADCLYPGTLGTYDRGAPQPGHAQARRRQRGGPGQESHRPGLDGMSLPPGGP
jgi:FixJ family two-component response regulator